MRTTRSIAGVLAAALALAALAGCATNPTGSARGTATLLLESLAAADLESALPLIDSRSGVVPGSAEPLPAAEIAAAPRPFSSFEIVDERVDDEAGVGEIVANVTGGTLDSPLEIDLVKGGPKGETWLVRGLSTPFPTFRIMGQPHWSGTLPGGTELGEVEDVTYYGIPGMELDVLWTEENGYFEDVVGLSPPGNYATPTEKFYEFAISELTAALTAAMERTVASVDPAFARLIAEPELISVVPSGGSNAYRFEWLASPGLYERCTPNFTRWVLDEAPLFGADGPITIEFDPYTAIDPAELDRSSLLRPDIMGPLSNCGV